MMKNMFRLVLPILPLMLVAACQPKQQNEALPDTTTLLWVDGFNRGDNARLLSAYTKDAAVLAPNSTIARGPDAIKQLFSSTIDQNFRVSVKNEESEMRGDIGYRLGTYLLQDNEGRELDHGKYI